jgi:hypothetical protein
MPESETPRRTTLASVRLADPASGAGEGALDPVLAQVLEALGLPGPAKAQAAAVLAQRLGDARTVGLLAVGDAAAFAPLLRAAMDAAEAGEVLRLGAILVAQGVVAARRLEAALSAQRQSGRRIGEELVAAGQLAAREVAEALWLQHKLRAAARALAAEAAARDAPAAPRLIHAARGS